MITLNKEDAFTIVDIISKAQEVIRCKDCKYWITKEWGYKTTPWCNLFYTKVDRDADDFCSRGERR